MSQNVLQHRNRVQWITRQYNYLRGLRQVLAGVMLLIVAATQAGWLPWYRPGQTLPTIAMLVLFGIALWPINRYYATTFGQVQRTSRDKIQDIVFGMIFMVVVYIVATTELILSWPVSITCMVLSIIWLWPFGRIRPDSPISVRYLVSGLLMVGVGLLPLTGVVAATDVYLFAGGVGVAILGGLCIINGLLDHLTLVQSFPPVQEEV